MGDTFRADSAPTGSRSCPGRCRRVKQSPDQPRKRIGGGEPKLDVVAARDAFLAERLEHVPLRDVDLSPIEPVWSKVKQLLRTEEARELPRLLDAISEAFAKVTCDDRYDCFADCRYTLHLH